MKKQKGTARLRIWVVLTSVLALFVLVFVLFDQLVALAPAGRRKENPPVQVDDAIGATLEPLDRATARTLDIGPKAAGLVVTSVSSNGPASRAGMRPGDVVEKIDRTRIQSLKQAADAIGQGGHDVTLTLHRDHHYAIVHVKTRPSGESERADQESER